LPLKIQEWMAVMAPSRLAWVGRKGWSSRYHSAS